MNGISLAALLGAAGWLGSEIFDEDEVEETAAAAAVDLPPAVEEAETRDNDFLWPSGPMFQ
jgi:hypothetical protein